MLLHLVDSLCIPLSLQNEQTTLRTMASSKRKRHEATAEKKIKRKTVDLVETTDKPLIGSLWLGNFLSRKRDSTVPTPEVYCASEDTFLRDFSNQFAPTSEAVYESDDDSTSDKLVPIGADGKQSDIEILIDIDIVEAESVPIVATISKLKIFNLPYRIRATEITDLFAKYGFELASVTLDVDKRTSLPAGSATVELAPGFDEADALKSLKGQTCGGRPLKVMSNKPQVKKRMSSFGGQGGRYFLGRDDGVAELKCNSCGKAHKTMDCDADQVNPCHLCAARDHESADCPNITCFRCGEFGHHSRTCNSARRPSRAFICTLCASSTHDARHCLQPSEKALARLEDKSIRCMRCNQLGHALCGTTVEKKSTKIKPIFCPNCGEEGHHVDYPTDTSHAGSILGGLNICQAPRYEAYIKFPKLLSGIDHMGSDGGDRDDRAKLYQSLVWSGGSTEQLQNLFPSLTRNKTPGNNVRRNTISASDNSHGRESMYEDDSRRNSYGNRNSDGHGNDDHRGGSYAASSSSYRDIPPTSEYDNGQYSRDSNGRQSLSSRHSSSYIVQESFVQVRGHSNDVLRSTFGRRVQTDDSHSSHSSRSKYGREHSADQHGLHRRASTGKLNSGRDGDRVIRRF